MLKDKQRDAFAFLNFIVQRFLTFTCFIFKGESESDDEANKTIDEGKLFLF